MTVAPDNFKKALQHWASGVCVATTACPREGSVGITVSSFASLSLEPPLVLFCVGRGSRSHDVFLTADHFAISILNSTQEAIANRFAGNWDQRWQNFSYDTPDIAQGSPIIPDCLAWLACDKHAVYDGADHSIVVGRVTATEVNFDKRQKPLTYWKRRYHSLTSA